MTDAKTRMRPPRDAFLAGDVAAFDGIVRRWQGRLVNLAWRFCRDRMMAEDMAQDAFVRAFRALHTYRGDAAFSSWLTAVAMNSYRSAVRERPPVACDFDPARLSSVESSAPAGLEARERAALVQRLVLTLPARYREAMVLFYFQDMDLSETARVLGLREGTVKARLHRGRDQLKRRLIAIDAQASGSGHEQD